ncbi:hypothetical protein H8A99_05765 [Bradyrhizobium sp. Arg68]|uniref:hypothetical protein n=1 Tax=Bradyrhizobium ivorense TaxID=2511166 RepID=UPI001E372301|nr:hypothetical protein [Bradyrhizobium ivorense]MCC8936010.1 hypothetical protein [Bradyrhizobium ivorense]
MVTLPKHFLPVATAVSAAACPAGVLIWSSPTTISSLMESRRASASANDPTREVSANALVMRERFQNFVIGPPT